MLKHGAAIFSRPMPLLVSVGFLLTVIIMISKVAVSSGIRPLELGLAGSLGAGIILFCVVAVRSDLPSWSRSRLLLYFILGIVSFGFPNVITFLVVQHAGPAYGATVYALSPLFTFIIAASFGVERLSLSRFIGILTGLIGASLVLSQKVVGSDVSGGIFWALLGLTIPASLATGNVLRTAFWPKGASPASFASATLLVSALQLIIVAFIIDDPTSWGGKTSGDILLIAALIVASAVMYLLLFRLQHIAGAVFLSQIGYWATGFGVIFSFLLFGDLISLFSIGGIILIIAGSVLVRKRSEEA